MNKLFYVKFHRPFGTQAELFLGNDVEQHGEHLIFSAKTFIAEALRDYASDLGEPTKRNSPLPEHADWDSEATPLLDEDGKTKYNHYVGQLGWIHTLSRYDLSVARSMLSKYLSRPRTVHMNMVTHVYGWLRKHPDLGIAMDGRDPIGLPEYDEGLRKSLIGEYDPEPQEVNPYDPEPLGPVYELWGAYDSDWASCEESRRSVSGVIIYLGRTPIFSKSIRQAGLAASSFSAEMAAGRVFVETMLGFRAMLKSMGIRIKDGSRGFGDNLSQVQNVTLHCTTEPHEETSHRDRVPHATVGTSDERG